MVLAQDKAQAAQRSNDPAVREQTAFTSGNRKRKDAEDEESTESFDPVNDQRLAEQQRISTQFDTTIAGIDKQIKEQQAITSQPGGGGNFNLNVSFSQQPRVGDQFHNITKAKLELQGATTNAEKHRAQTKIDDAQRQIDRLRVQYNLAKDQDKARRQIAILQKEKSRQIEGRQVALTQSEQKFAKERAARSAIEGAQTQSGFLGAVFSFRKTEFGAPIFEEIASRDVTKQLAEAERLKRLGRPGGEINVARNKAKFIFLGGSAQEFDRRRQAEVQNRRTHLQRSGGLRAFGNQTIQQSIKKELARLGGGVSPNLGKDSRITSKVKPSAVGTTAALAQPWRSGFTITSSGSTVAFKQPSVQEKAFAAVATPETSFGKARTDTTPIGQTARVSPLLAPLSAQQQGPRVQKQKYAVTVNGKTRTFNTLKQAEKFVDRLPEQEVITPLSIEAFVSSQTPQATGYQVQTPSGTRTFATKQDAKNFIENEKNRLPLQDSPLLEPIAQHIEDRARINKRLAEKNPNNIFLQVADAGSSFQATTATAIIGARDFVQKNILGREPVPKRPFTITPTFYDAGIQEATKGVKVSTEAPFITGVPPLNPLKEGNVFQKAFEGAQKQAGKQSTARNIGQTIVAAPIVALDVVTLGRGGTALIRGGGRVGAKITSKVQPTLVNVALNAPQKVTIGQRVSIAKVPAVQQARRPAQVTGTSLLGQLQGRQRISGTSPLQPNVNVKPDTTFKPPTRASEVKEGVGTGVIPKEDVTGQIRFTRGFVPNKPDLPVTRQIKPVETDPFYNPAKRASEIPKGSDISAAFKKDRVNIGRGIAIAPEPQVTNVTPTVRPDPFYKPATRVNEIPRGSDISASFTSQRISMAGVGREFKRKTNLPGFTGLRFTGSLGPKPKTQRDVDLFKPRTFDEPRGGEVSSGRLLLLQKQKSKKKTKTTQEKALLLSLRERQQSISSTSPRFLGAKVTQKPKITTVTKQVQKAKTERRKRQAVRGTGIIAGVEGTRLATSTQLASAQKAQTKQTARSITRSQTRQSERLATKPRISSRFNTKPKLTPKLTPRLGTSQAFRTPTPQRPKPKTRAATARATRPAQRQIIRVTEPPRSPRVIAAGLPGDRQRKETKGKKKRIRREDFLGNVELGSIVGFVKRSDIIVGDKKVQKALDKSRKGKGPKRSTQRFNLF